MQHFALYQLVCISLLNFNCGLQTLVSVYYTSLRSSDISHHECTAFSKSIAVTFDYCIPVLPHTLAICTIASKYPSVLNKLVRAEA